MLTNEAQEVKEDQNPVPPATSMSPTIPDPYSEPQDEPVVAAPHVTLSIRSTVLIDHPAHDQESVAHGEADHSNTYPQPSLVAPNDANDLVVDPLTAASSPTLAGSLHKECDSIAFPDTEQDKSVQCAVMAGVAGRTQ
ncbi:hypothetical protein K432DRAFT_453138 [Lepidopterella palustris CBS 459.81]|uniref:Uncharacterized protein n=1 Tax=Lepidopterella palustris CBS 459.81 TaxID=1314670 RepID=A0A8E2EB06_9PEZI|nr:hypothetical protein K432DRAFT_453138 [Lepidopterella palustris CBS 459.81]